METYGENENFPPETKLMITVNLKLTVATRQHVASFAKELKWLSGMFRTHVLIFLLGLDRLLSTFSCLYKILANFW